MNFRSWGTACVLVMSITSGASAQAPAPAATPVPGDQQVAQIQAQDYRDRAARGLFEAASVAYEEGRYEEALEHFTKAYELSPTRHLLLYNIASSQDRLRRDSEALANFQRYLELNPTASNRQAVEARVQVLKQAVAAHQAEEAERDAAQEKAEAEAVAATKAASPAAEVAAPEPSERRGVKRWVTYAGAGVTAALAAVTLVSGLQTNKANDEYESYSKTPGATASESKRLYDEGHAFQTTTNVLAAGTLVVGVTTGVIAAFFTDWRTKEQRIQPQVSVSTNHLKLGLSHAF